MIRSLWNCIEGKGRKHFRRHRLQKLTNTALERLLWYECEKSFEDKTGRKESNKEAVTVIQSKKMKDLNCHWSGNEEQVCVDFTSSGLDHVNGDGLDIYQVIEHRRRYRYPLLLYQMIFVCFNYESHTVLHTGNIVWTKWIWSLPSWN